MGKVKTNQTKERKYLSLFGNGKDALTLIIIYLQNHHENAKELANASLNNWFLPFAMDINDPEFKKIALKCAVACESRGALIREYAGLGHNKNAAPVSTEPIQKVVPLNKESKKKTKSSQKTTKVGQGMGLNF